MGRFIADHQVSTGTQEQSSLGLEVQQHVVLGDHAIARDLALSEGDLLRAEADPPASDKLTLALAAYETAYHDTPSIMGMGACRNPALAAILQQAVAAGQPLKDAELRRHLGIAPPHRGSIATPQKQVVSDRRRRGLVAFKAT